MNVKKLRRILIVILVLVVAGFTAINMYMAGNLSTVPPAPTLQQSFAPAAIGGTFSLTDQHGNTRTDTEFRGKLMLVYFGFTSCPDVCPVALLSMTNALNQIGEKAAGVVPIFITLDPERDNVEKVKEYMANFHPTFVGLTGAYPDIEKVVDAYKAYAAKQPADAQGNYLVDHSSFIYLMGRDGNYLAHFAHNASEADIAKAIEAGL